MLIMRFSDIKELLWNRHINYLHVTDQKCYNNYTYCLKVSIIFRVGQKSMESSVEALRMIFQFAKYLTEEGPNV